MIRGADGSGGAKVIYVKARRRFKTITPKNVKGRERERSGGIDCDAWKCCWESLDVRSVPVWVCMCAYQRVCRCTSPHQEVCEAYGPQTFKFKAEVITHDPKVLCVIVRA